MKARKVIVAAIVASVALWIFGALSSFRKLPPTPRSVLERTLEDVRQDLQRSAPQPEVEKKIADGLKNAELVAVAYERYDPVPGVCFGTGMGICMITLIYASARLKKFERSVADDSGDAQRT